MLGGSDPVIEIGIDGDGSRNGWKTSANPYCFTASSVVSQTGVQGFLIPQAPFGMTFPKNPVNETLWGDLDDKAQLLALVLGCYLPATGRRDGDSS